MFISRASIFRPVRYHSMEEFEINKLERLLKEADIPHVVRDCVTGIPYRKIYYPTDCVFDEMCPHGGAVVVAYTGRQDSLLHYGDITLPDWKAERAGGPAKTEDGKEFCADEVFPLWWADWLYRQEVEKQ